MTAVAEAAIFAPGHKAPIISGSDCSVYEPDGELPIAALTRASDGAQKTDPHQFWLRTDPVTLWADMARVVMTSHGFADLDRI